MFGAVDARFLMDDLYRQGWREQLSFADEFPPCIYIDRDKLTSVSMGYNWNGFSMIYSQDHPAFTQLRERLNEEGYIEIQRGWWNGDRVTKPFYLNNMYFDIGEQFSCAPALGVTYDIAYRKNECSPEYGGISDRPFRPKEDATSAERDSEQSEAVSETLPLPL
jgi:hypothetical protein